MSMSNYEGSDMFDEGLPQGIHIAYEELQESEEFVIHWYELDRLEEVEKNMM